MRGRRTHVLHPTANFKGLCIFFADFALDTQIIDHVAVTITQRCDKKLVPEYAPISAVIEQDHGGVFPLFDPFPNAVHRAWIGLWSLQEPAVAAEDLVQRVAAMARLGAGGQVGANVNVTVSR